MTWSPTASPSVDVRSDLGDRAGEHAARAGDRVVHLAPVRMMSSTSARTAAPSPLCLSNSWRNDAASRLSRATSTRTSSAPSSGLVSSRSAACGNTPGGASTRCRPVGSLARSLHKTSGSLRPKPQDLRRCFAGTVYSPVLWHENDHTTQTLLGRAARPRGRCGGKHDRAGRPQARLSSSPTRTSGSSSSSPTGPGSRAGRTSPPRTGRRSSGSAPTASRTSSSCAP